MGGAHGVSDQQLRDLARYRESPAFSELERDVLDLAVAMATTPADVPADVVDRLRRRLDVGQLVELTAAIAWENYRARFNRVFGVEPVGFAPVRRARCPSARASARMDRRRLIELALPVQNRVLNPLICRLIERGLAPLTYALIEAIGRWTGRPRRVPVANGLDSETFWLIAGLGDRAAFVHNLKATPRVRVRTRPGRLRDGLRMRWRTGTACPLPTDDAEGPTTGSVAAAPATGSTASCCAPCPPTNPCSPSASTSTRSRMSTGPPRSGNPVSVADPAADSCSPACGERFRFGAASCENRALGFRPSRHSRDRRPRRPALVATRRQRRAERAHGGLPDRLWKQNPGADDPASLARIGGCMDDRRWLRCSDPLWVARPGRAFFAACGVPRLAAQRLGLPPRRRRRTDRAKAVGLRLMRLPFAGGQLLAERASRGLMGA